MSTPPPRSSAPPLEYSLLLTATLCLLAMGAVMVFSASSARSLLSNGGSGFYYLERTLVDNCAISQAVEEVRKNGLYVISLNMAGSVPDAADMVISDPIQAGVMAVMAIADTAKFDLIRQQNEFGRFLGLLTEQDAARVHHDSGGAVAGFKCDALDAIGACVAIAIALCAAAQHAPRSSRLYPR